MTITDASSTLSSVTWSDEQLYLKEFIHRFSLPAIVRVVKGQYCNVGVSGGPLSGNANLQSTLLLVGLGKKKRIVAQNVKFKDSRKVVALGPKLAIPCGYDGYFEILSEDGRAVRCIESVVELTRRFPDSVLVRDNFRAFVSKSDDLNAITDDLKQARMVEAGETLILVGEVTSTGKNFLRCLDANGENVYLPYDLKGCRFSAIAKEENISGVHTSDNLLNKRMPMMVRLAHGLAPVGLKNPNQFVPELRLYSAIDEEALVGLTLSSKDSQVVPLPAPAVLKLQYATNIKYLRETKEFSRLNERCLALASHLTSRMLVHDIHLQSRDLRINGADNKQKVNIQQQVSSNRQQLLNSTSHQRRVGSAFNTATSKLEEGRDDWDEIEQIYDYVRGFAPLPKTARGWRYEPTPPQSPTKQQLKDDIYSTAIQQANHHNNIRSNQNSRNSMSLPASSPTTPTANMDVFTDPARMSINSSQPPEPPPIETMPSRRSLAHHHNNGQIPSQPQSPMEVSHTTYPVNFAAHMIKCPMPNKNSTDYGSSSLTVKEAKKRQRKSSDKLSNNNSHNNPVINTSISNENKMPNHLSPSTPLISKTPGGVEMGHSGGHGTTRFMKSANHKSSHRFFRKHSMKDSTCSPPVICTSPSPGGHTLYGSKSSGNHASPMFQLRYKSLTNLASAHHASAEYDTLDSSNSGGKASGDSAGGSSSANRSSNLPEKRSRRGSSMMIMQHLSRPKSLTNLVWGGLGGSTTSINMRSSSSRQNLLLDPSGNSGGMTNGNHCTSGNSLNMSQQDINALASVERQRRLEPGVYGHYQPTRQTRRTLSRENFHISSPAASSVHIGKKLGGSKRIGTLYL